MAAHRDHGRTAIKIEGEFLGEGVAQGVSFEFGNELAEGRTEGEIADGEAARPLDPREILFKLRSCRRLHESRNDKVRERAGCERNPPERLKVEKPHPLGGNCLLRGHIFLLFFPRRPCHKTPPRETMYKAIAG